MSKKVKIEKLLIRKIDKMNRTMERNNILELAEILGNTKKMLVKNFFSGIAKGVGIGIGFSLLTAVLIYLLQRIIRLNIPIISEYITDIVEIVENNK